MRTPVVTFLALVLLVSQPGAAEDVVITEFMALNRDTLVDGSGNSSDWIEVQNFGDAAVDLGGWFLTDDAQDLRKWSFPEGLLQPGGLLLVFASGEGVPDPAGNLHASFELSAQGEYLALVRADGQTIASEFRPMFSSQVKDVSFGVALFRTPEGGLQLGGTGYFLEPTPGQLNGTNIVAGFAGAPRFSVARGFFDRPMDLVVEAPTPGSTLVYTTNQSTPSLTNGIVVPSGPTPDDTARATVQIGTTLIVRAAAFKEGLAPSRGETHTYLYLEDVVQQPADPPGFPTTWAGFPADYAMDERVVTDPAYAAEIIDDLRSIPTLSIVMDMADLFGASSGIYANSTSVGDFWERAGSIELIRPDGSTAFQENCGVRVWGTGWRPHNNSRKHSLQLKFKKRYGSGKLHYPLFKDTTVTEFDNLVLRAQGSRSWNDFRSPDITQSQYIRDSWCRDTRRAMGNIDGHATYVHLYLNGLYWGLYNPVEKTDENFAAKYYGGDKTEYDVITRRSVVEVDAGDKDGWDTLMQIVNAGVTTPEQYALVQQHLDIDHFIDYYLLGQYASNHDGVPNSGNNMRAVHRRVPGGQFRFHVWDMEYTFWSETENNMGTDVVDSGVRIFRRLTDNPEFRLRYADHVQRHMFSGGALTPGPAAARWLARADEIVGAVVCESARWGDVRRPSRAYTRNVEWTNELNRLVNSYFPKRTAILLGQLKAVGLFPEVPAPEFSQQGGDVTPGAELHVSAPAGTIYLTMDGTDPRLEGGAISPQATTELTIVFSDSVHIKARTLLDGEWSAMNEASFRTRLSLRFTEIMYNPPGAGPVLGDEFEFVELKNVGSFSFDLGGLTFTSGIRFTFPSETLVGPGEILVLVRNPSQFSARYPGVEIAGVYTGKLDDDGETLTLSQPLAGPDVISVSYSDELPWAIQPDGHGFSLVPVEIGRVTWSEAADWRASSEIFGSPGEDDPDLGIAKVVVNEVVSAAGSGQLDSIELYNPETTSVDLGGWYLSDDRAEPRKFRIPDGTVVEANGYLVFTSNDFDPSPGTTNNFALSRRGDGAYLFSGSAEGELTGYGHGFEFGASGEGDSFGRYVTSTGEEQFPLQEIQTLGLPNVGPRTGPVVITEIMYHPPSGGDEYVEVKSIAAAVVPLFDPAAPENGWRISGLDYEFPAGAILRPNEVALVVPIAPEEFRTKYGVPVGVAIYGPYSGALQDGGERLKIQRPSGSGANEVAYITVEEVGYAVHPDWPRVTSGTGPSLQRLDATVYGNDPINWTAAAPSLGGQYAGGIVPVVTMPPVSEAMRQLGEISFEVMASGSSPLRYQWQFFGTNLPGATERVLVLGELEFWQSGPYRVTVYNSAGAVTSSSAVLRVLPLPRVLAGPKDQAIPVGGNAVFEVVATGTDFVAYQWRFNGVEIADATNSMLTLTEVDLADSGDYSVQLTDSVGSSVSDEAELRVLVRPVISQQPLGFEVIAGSDVTLSIAISNTVNVPIGYRWRRNGRTITTISLDRRICFFTVTNVQSDGSYTVVVTNEANRVGILSANAKIVVVPDADGDGMPDGWEERWQLDPGDAGDAGLDRDGDGLTSLQEYIAGTSPEDPNSSLAVAPGTNTAPTGVQFSGVSNRTYTVEWKHALTEGRWTKLLDLVARSSNRVERVRGIYPTGAGRLYRVVTPRQAGVETSDPGDLLESELR